MSSVIQLMDVSGACDWDPAAEVVPAGTVSPGALAGAPSLPRARLVSTASVRCVEGLLTGANRRFPGEITLGVSERNVQPDTALTGRRGVAIPRKWLDHCRPKFSISSAAYSSTLPCGRPCRASRNRTSAVARLMAHG